MVKSHPKKENQVLGWLASKNTSRTAAKAIQCSVGRAEYHRKKVNDPLFHPKQHGGALYNKRRTFPKQIENVIKSFLWWQCNRRSTTRLKGYVQKLKKRTGVVF